MCAHWCTWFRQGRPRRNTAVNTLVAPSSPDSSGTSHDPSRSGQTEQRHVAVAVDEVARRTGRRGSRGGSGTGAGSGSRRPAATRGPRCRRSSATIPEAKSARRMTPARSASGQPPREQPRLPAKRAAFSATSDDRRGDRAASSARPRAHHVVLGQELGPHAARSVASGRLPAARSRRSSRRRWPGTLGWTAEGSAAPAEPVTSTKYAPSSRQYSRDAWSQPESV